MKPVRWYHAFAVSDQGMKTATLDERRVEHARTEVVPDAGWHLSYFMALNDIARKARPSCLETLNVAPLNSTSGLHGAWRWSPAPASISATSQRSMKLHASPCTST